MRPEIPEMVIDGETLQEWRERLAAEPLPELLVELRAQPERSPTATLIYALLLEGAPLAETAGLFEETLAALCVDPQDVCLCGALQSVLDSVPVETLGEMLQRVYQKLPASIALEIALPAWLRLIQHISFDDFRRPFEVCERDRNEDGGLVCSRARMELWARIALTARPAWWLETFQHWTAKSAELVGGSALWPDLETWGAYVAVREKFLKSDPLCQAIDDVLRHVVIESPDARERFLEFNRSLLSDLPSLDRAFPLTGSDLDPPIKHAWYTAAYRMFEHRLSSDPSPVIYNAVELIPPRWQRSRMRIPWDTRRWSPRDRVTMGILFLGLPLLGAGFGFWWDALSGAVGSSRWFVLGALPLALLGWYTQSRGGHGRGTPESIQTYRDALREALVWFLRSYPLTRAELLKELRGFVSERDSTFEFLLEAEHDAALWFYALAARVTD